MPDLAQCHHRLLIAGGIAVGGTLCAPALAAAGVTTALGGIIVGAIASASASVATGIFANDMINHHKDHLGVK